MKLSPRFFLQTILLAVRQIRAHKLRSFLTTLGIMIGVASVSTVIAALTGLKEQVLSEFESFGASKMFIFPDQPDRAGQNRYPWREIKLKERELDGLVENCPSFEQFTPNTDFRATVIHGRKEVPNINVVGIWPSWHDIENRPVIMGRPFVEADEIDAKPVAIVNDDAIAELELPPNPVGSIIMVKGRRLFDCRGHRDQPHRHDELSTRANRNLGALLHRPEDAKSLVFFLRHRPSQIPGVGGRSHRRSPLCHAVDAAIGPRRP